MAEYKGLVLADIHIGALSVSQTYKELQFLKDYLRDRYFDFIIVAGDLFDKKLYSGEEYIVIANELIVTLLKSCTKLRLVYGTKSHDNEQYSIFKQYESNTNSAIMQKLDFRVIPSVEEEQLFPEVKVLYIPEEYIHDKKEYYKEYFEKEKEYDYVFGHGIIKEAMTNAVRNMKKSSEKRVKAPVFKTTELEKICRGQVYFGHYHVNTNIHDKVFYVGSYSRDRFGEEEQKGFYEINFDGIDEYTNQFIENSVTETYCTIPFSYNHRLFKEGTDLVEEFKMIQKRKEKSKIDYLRLIFNIPDEYPDAEFFIKLVMDTFHSEDGYKVEITNGYIETKKNINRQQFQEVKEKFSYVFDQNTDIEKIISYFIKDKWKKEIPPEKVKKYLQFKALDILSQE